jgi:hypothetical protein
MNMNKTEICIFCKYDCRPMNIRGDNTIIARINSNNGLEVLFDIRLQWSDHVAKAIVKSNKKLNAKKTNQMILQY